MNTTQILDSETKQWNRQIPSDLEEQILELRPWLQIKLKADKLSLNEINTLLLKIGLDVIKKEHSITI